MMKNEEGSVAILTLMSMLVLALALVIAIEFACVYAQKSVYDNDLNVAREETFSSGFSMQLKNSDDPAGLICTSITNSLRSNNYSGAITLWFYEATEEEIEASSSMIDSAVNMRCIAYQVQLQDPYKTIVAPSNWLSQLSIANQTCAALCPYALHRTYRPDDEREGILWRYSIAENESSPSSSPQRFEKSEMTPHMQKALEESYTKAEELAKPLES